MSYLRKIGEGAYFILGGRRYRWWGWFGCQLESFEWRRVPAGTEREIVGRKFRVFRTERVWLRIRTLWCLAGLGRSIDHDNEQLHALRRDLQELI